MIWIHRLGHQTNCNSYDESDDEEEAAEVQIVNVSDKPFDYIRAWIG